MAADVRQRKSVLDREELANIWRSILRADPTALFESESARLEARAGLGDEIAQPGLVGPRYASGGVLFLGKNPGKGGSDISESDRIQYDLLRALRDAPDSELLERFDSLNEILATRVMPSWSLVQKYIQPVFAAAGWSMLNVAYLNLLKWRSEAVNTTLLRASWSAHTRLQYRALRPSFVVVLGRTTFDPFVGFLNKFGDERPTYCAWIKRRRRDTQDPDETALAQIRKISRDLVKHFNGSAA